MEARTKIQSRQPAVLTLVIAFLLFAFNGYSQSFSGSSNKSKVGVGERFRLTYKIENLSGSNFKLPAMTDFSLVGGPYQSQQMSMVNGTTSQSTQISYDFVANKKGKFTIAPATVQTSKGTVKSNPIEIEVGEGTLGNQSGSSSNSSGGTVPQGSGGDIFIVATANRNSVYEGEQITLTIKLYSQYNNVSMEEISYPELKGGWVQDVQDAVDTRFRSETYNGKRYNTATLRKSILVPTAPGKLVFDPVKASVVVQKVVRSNDPWENIFGGQVQQERVKLTSSKITFDVLPLPAGNKPQSFVNAVGKFEFKAALDKNEVEANDAVNLKITVSGNGNLMLLQNPGVKFPSTFEVPEPIINDKYKITTSGISGSKEFEYLVIPRSGGDFTLGPFAFSYFDPATKKYHELRTDSMKLKVNGAVIENISTGGDDVELLEKDIRYIDDKATKLSPVQKFFYRSALFYMLVALPFFLSLLIIVFRRQLFKRTPDLEQKRIRQADSVALRRLKAAKAMLDANNRDKYYEELNKALMGYLSDKYSIAFADMNRGFIREKLAAKNLREDLVQKVMAIVEACEFARFAPGSGEQQAHLYQDTLNLITELEKQK